MNTNIIEPVEKEMIDPVEKMMVHLTGKRLSELSRKDKAIKFPVKVRECRAEDRYLCLFICFTYDLG